MKLKNQDKMRVVMEAVYKEYRLRLFPCLSNLLRHRELPVGSYARLCLKVDIMLFHVVTESDFSKCLHSPNPC